MAKKGHNLTALIKWLEGFPASKRYSYISVSNCLAAQYMRSLGRDYSGEGLPRKLSAPWNAPFPQQLELIAVNGPYTFGEALIRAKMLKRGLNIYSAEDRKILLAAEAA